MTWDDVLTPRLRLVVMQAQVLQAETEDRSAFALALGADVPPAWPPEHWEPHVFDFLAEQYARTPHTIPWNRYVVLRTADPVLIGKVNGFPKGDGEAEIGYSILPEWQRKGVD